MLPFAALAALACGPAAAGVIDLSATNTTGDPFGTPVTLKLASGIYQITYATKGLYSGFTDSWGEPSGCDKNGAACANGWSDAFGYTIQSKTPVSGGFAIPNPTSRSYGQRYATAALALAAYSNALPTTRFELTEATNVTFFVPDYGGSGDNAGGLSLNVTQIPEPESAVILAVAGLGVFLVWRRREGRRHEDAAPPL